MNYRFYLNCQFGQYTKPYYTVHTVHIQIKCKSYNPRNVRRNYKLTNPFTVLFLITPKL